MDQIRAISDASLQFMITNYIFGIALLVLVLALGVYIAFTPNVMEYFVGSAGSAGTASSAFSAGLSGSSNQAATDAPPS
jgi:hypothetical protein